LLVGSRYRGNKTINVSHDQSPVIVQLNAPRHAGLPLFTSPRRMAESGFDSPRQYESASVALDYLGPGSINAWIRSAPSRASLSIKALRRAAASGVSGLSRKMAPSWPSATISPSLSGKMAASSSGGLAKKNLSEKSRYSGHFLST